MQTIKNQMDTKKAVIMNDVSMNLHQGSSSLQTSSACEASILDKTFFLIRVGVKKGGLTISW